MTVTVRAAAPEDIAAMEALIKRSGIELSAGFYTSEQARAVTQHVFGVDTQLVADQTYFLVEQQGKLVACGGWSGRSTASRCSRKKSTSTTATSASRTTCSSCATWSTSPT